MAQAEQVTFEFVGAPQTWVVPDNVTLITIDARGAQGGDNPYNPPAEGGKGGRVQTTLAVSPGEILTIYVGGRGGDLTSPNTAGPGGFNGGGAGGIDTVDFNAPGGGGGGASDVRQGGDGLAHRVVVAGGGGGAECCSGAIGGDGGGTTGMSGGTVGGGSEPGGGGTQSEGGSGGAGCDGSGTSGILGQGGVGGNGNRAGGGGGGGYYGGGGGGGCGLGSGGGGGSSYAAGTNTTHTQGYQAGNGQIIIAYCSSATVINGPVANPANGNSYYLLDSSTWTASEAEAVALCGHLTTINDQEEQDWVFGQFGLYLDTNRNLWIGLRSTTAPTPASNYTWVSGDPATYRNWAPPEPNDPPEFPGQELYVHMYSPDHGQYPGLWNNCRDSGACGPIPNGVVEVPCNPSDSLPPEVQHFRWHDESTLTWDALGHVSGCGTTYDVMCGDLEDVWYLGTGADDRCLASDLAETQLVDCSPTPDAGRGWFFLVRASNRAGVGRWETASDGNHRLTTVCEGGPFGCP
jgi:hypothetical protein